MTFEESYNKYLILSESNGTTNNLATNRFNYATMFNMMQNKVCEWLIEANGTDENRYLQKIKVPHTTLGLPVDTKEHFQSFNLPTDYFEYIDLNVYATKNKCKDQLLTTREIKSENTNNLLNDPYSNPSFKYRETFHTIAKDSIQVYREDFTITRSDLMYYRIPVQIELENPDNPESKFKNLQTEFDDKLTNRIIFSTVSLHSLSSDDPKFQAFKQETIQKF